MEKEQTLKLLAHVDKVKQKMKICFRQAQRKFLKVNIQN